MRNLKTIRREASGVVRAVTGPLGPRSLQRVISEHLGFFSELRAEGANWEQIAALMASEGLRSRTGGVVSAGVLRALCSRAMGTSNTRRPAQAPGASSSDTTERLVAAPITPAGPNLGGSSLAKTIERAARLRGMVSNNGNDDDET